MLVLLRVWVQQMHWVKWKVLVFRQPEREAR
jgi:hypothetical protein